MMPLKNYQHRALAVIDQYLQALSDWRDKALNLPEDVRSAVDFPGKAWEAVGGRQPYHAKRTGTGEPLPHFCLKVPTGGGKTYLAVQTIDRIQQRYLHRLTGLVLWIVPTQQIYRQTLAHLRDRHHPYRQFLDVATGGRVMVVEKTDRFTPDDVATRLVVVLLMLPSANRRDKETLKLFQDASGFDAFFPAEGDYPAHEQLLQRWPNLDYFGDETRWFGRQVKTSLGNVLRISQPVIIVDEGQKAYSASAQDTIRGFNPALIVELSATPPKGSNILVDIRGRDLDQEEMIKLDLHVTNRASARWQDTLADSVAWRDALEEEAVKYEARTGIYIRPISLIQVERTGKDQVDAGYIHAEHVKQALMDIHGVPEDHIAIKSSEQDDIEGIDLLAKDCPIRYIITKQALQEGWDCPFAYVLTVLTNPSSQTALTQLVGRILRQPYAKKTGVSALDESYVFCFQRQASELAQSIKAGLEDEGLGDLAHSVALSDRDGPAAGPPRTVGIRERFRRFEGKVYLPRFVITEEGREEELQYEMDLVQRIRWEHLRLDRLDTLVLGTPSSVDWEVAYGYAETAETVVEREHREYEAAHRAINSLFLTRRLEHLVPNPWVARDIVNRAIDRLRVRYDEAVIAANQVFLAQELENLVEAERDRLTEAIFRELIQQGKLRLVLMTGRAYRVPSRITIPRDVQKPLLHATGRTVQMSLFDDPVPAEWFNPTLEAPVALCLDSQEKLLFWYRNLVGRDYFSVQGWRKNRIWADFIAAKRSEHHPDDYDTIYVLETKGDQLAGNLDTQYKKQVFALCNELGKKITWTELGLEFPNRQVQFQVVMEDEWERVINELFA
ncbi:MAG: restriction endonuclease subunit R [Sulfobacillus acidophilus]|uniref:Restriction endonuclease subunit R n=1 Tax=Sulfobacillus acidophilus TaxID=53633 RepID=A0A2T2WNP7_9FIRM|nr:MAG: restriction endonuclease subunit R [Sulfobacillus acidophilus]